MALSVSTGGGHAVVSKKPLKSHRVTAKGVFLHQEQVHCGWPGACSLPTHWGHWLLASLPPGNISATRKYLWVLPGALHEALKVSACLGWWDESRRSRAGLFGSVEHAGQSTALYWPLCLEVQR